MLYLNGLLEDSSPLAQGNVITLSGDEDDWNTSIKRKY
ncbi:hypothetical protein SAMN05216352_104218 [Alteribacillus bidgolensis]|uniref:Uncharacterized protein n=1 Tax=Alteribacillus bidgolensis TaxID=930129 RepID=A0A1G8HE19_9BACI|nr:hypothetical protein SAMN05216352_104218 [Alteribacillus bidgolensis]